MPRTAPVPNIPAIPGMNPGVIVAGGGGAGGGKGAGKGKGKGGKNGAGDGSGEEGAEGGGKGAGSCGQGSPGACSNCGHNVSAGDPVDVSTGEVFTNPYQDLFLPGRFNLALVRSYSSARRDLDVGLGFGWCFSLSWTLHVVGRKLHLVTGDGRRLEFPALESNNSSVAYGRYVLVRRDPFYVVYPGSEFAHVFVERESAGDRRQYELRWVRYRNRGELTLRYDRRQLVAVTDTVGRTVDIHREPQGRIGRISVKAPNGARLDAAHFAYDHDGNLVSAVSANGYATRFVYGPRHELTQIAYPNGLDVHFLYDAQLRCVETWGDRADGRDPALDSHQPEYLADGTTPFKGIYHAHLDFVDEGYTEVADSVRVRRFFSTPAGVIDKAVGGVGNVTTRQFDEHQNCVEQVDGNGATWSWEYDELGNVTSATDPLGATLGIQRNLLGQETLLLDQLGVETRIDRDRFGEIVGVSMANGATNRFVLDEYGSVLAATDARGGHHEFALDGHANRVMHRFPNAAEYRFEYDYWGRLIKTYDHDGRERCFTYSAGGQITSATDRLGRTRRFEYGPLDELVREVEADGTTHEFEYGGLAWLHTSRWADGTEVRAAYNAEGLITRLTNEVGASHAYAYDTDLRLASETDYSGRCTTYRYDDLGRVIAVDDRAGKTEYVRDPLGRVVEAVAPDGSALRYAYDARGSLIEAATSEGVHVRFTIDANGWVVREELTVDDRTYSVDAKRDVASERVHVGTSLGHELAAERDRNGQITTLSTPAEAVISFDRNIGGQVTRRRFARGGAIVDEWNAETELCHRHRIESGVGAPLVGEMARANGRTWSYRYDTTSELVAVDEPTGGSRTLRYDSRGRLIERADATRVEHFSYDAASNLFEQGPHAVGRRYETGDLLVQRGTTEFRYDDRGFLLEEIEHGGSSPVSRQKYTWDGWGRLQAVDSADGKRVEFTYDPFARRVGKRTLAAARTLDAHHYVWDQVALIHDVNLGHGQTSSAEYTTYLYADVGDVIPIGQRAPSGPEWVHYVADFNGVVEELVDASGRVVGSLTRSAFGRTHADPGSQVTTPFRFAGQVEDYETGLHYNRARYYDPDSGRYISPDPKGIYGLTGLNLYAYCPNPISWTDPGGLQHALTVTGDGVPVMSPPALGRGAPASGTLQYHAGRGGNSNPNRSSPPLPGGNTHPLWPTAATHSEQRFAHDLITQANTPPPGRFNGKNFNLRSEGNMPPCPACHSAMMRAAQVSGANVNYSWGTPPNVVNYAGGTGAPSIGAANEGTAAAPLLAAYGHTDAGNFTGAPNPNLVYPSGANAVNTPSQAWGYNIPPSAWDHYNQTK